MLIIIIIVNNGGKMDKMKKRCQSLKNPSMLKQRFLSTAIIYAVFSSAVSFSSAAQLVVNSADVTLNGTTSYTDNTNPYDISNGYLLTLDGGSHTVAGSAYNQTIISVQGNDTGLLLKNNAYLNSKDSGSYSTHAKLGANTFLDIQGSTLEMVSNHNNTTFMNMAGGNTVTMKDSNVSMKGTKKSNDFMLLNGGNIDVSLDNTRLAMNAVGNQSRFLLTQADTHVKAINGSYIEMESKGSGNQFMNVTGSNARFTLSDSTLILRTVNSNPSSTGNATFLKIANGAVFESTDSHIAITGNGNNNSLLVIDNGRFSMNGGNLQLTTNSRGTDFITLTKDAVFEISGSGRLTINNLYSDSSSNIYNGIRGIYAQNRATLNLGQEAQINTGSNHNRSSSYAIEIYHTNEGYNTAGNTTLVAEDINLQTHAQDSAGIYVHSLADSSSGVGAVTLNGLNNVITVTGDNTNTIAGTIVNRHKNNAHGIVTGDEKTWGLSGGGTLLTNAMAFSDFHLGDRGSATKGRMQLSTSGFGASGILSRYAGRVDLFSDHSTIITSGDKAIGLIAFGDAKVGANGIGNQRGEIVLEGLGNEIQTSGIESHGVYADAYGGVLFDNIADSVTQHSIHTTGLNAHAVFSANNVLTGGGGRINGVVVRQTSGSFAADQGDILHAEAGVIDATFKGSQLTAEAGRYLAYALDAGTTGSTIDLSGQEGAVFTGQLLADTNSQINMALGHATLPAATPSVWFGSVDSSSTGTVNLNIYSDGLWRVSAPTAISSLSLDRGRVELPAVNLALPSAVSSLTVQDLAGNGYFSLKVPNIVGANGLNLYGNKITVNGTISGQHALLIANDATLSTNGTEMLQIVELNGTGSGYFELNPLTRGSPGQVELGGYVYQFNGTHIVPGVRIGGGAVEEGNNNSATGGATSGRGNSLGNASFYPKVLTSTAKAAANFINTAYLISYIDNQTLLQRMGELQHGEAKGDVWVRGFAGRLDSFGGALLHNFDMDYQGLQVGTDRRLQTEHGSLYLGVAGGYTYGKPNYDRGQGKLMGYHGALYASYVNDDGWYVDGIVKCHRINNKFTVTSLGNELIKGEGRTNGYSLSLEGGKRFYFNRERNGIYLEPQLQISVAHQDGTPVTTSSGLNINLDSYTSILGRGSIVLGYTPADLPFNVYYKTGYVQEFSDNVGYSLNGSHENHKIRGGWWDNGLGITARINKNHSLYLDGRYATGSRFDQYQLNAGYRMTF